MILLAFSPEKAHTCKAIFKAMLLLVRHRSPARPRSIPAALSFVAARGFPVHPLFRIKDMAIGTVKWFNDAKRVGFATAEGGGKDLFAPFSASEQSGITRRNNGQRVPLDVS